MVYVELQKLAERGLATSIADSFLRQQGQGLTEQQQRLLLSRALERSAEIREQMDQCGQHLAAEWLSGDFALDEATFAQRRRAEAMKILLNPDGRKLEDQIKTIFSSL